MLRSSKQNLYLLALLTLLTTTALLINSLTKNQPIINLKPDEINRIVIETRDQPAIKMQKQEKTWQLMDTDKTVNASFEKIQLLLKLATAESLNQFATVDTELAKYELSPPKLTVYFNNQSIHFGGLEPINHLRYIQVNQTIHLIKDEFYRHFLTSKNDFLEN